MKKLLPLLLLFIYSTLSAQLDREHWFAPMYDGQSNTGPSQFLHLSTNETVPFNVNVYSNNALVYTRTISKGNPAIISIARNYIITNSIYDLHKVGNKGLYVQAERPCFANLRFKVTNHAEIITSKGTAGIGKKFYTVMAPNLQGSTNLGASASILATEDNTVVTVNNFKKVLTFNGYGTAPSFTFTLNKGQSFILDARAANMNNRDGFIGATVTADKPISMSNGNFNGQYATTDTDEGSDILMDQSVPVDKLGDEFAIVKGYGAIGNNMEGAVVVATENNTAIYLNDSTVPFATLATAGDHYVINETNYVDRGHNHYNLRIKTDKNVYVYQLLGGVEGGSAFLATGGMNYIPPLNCYLPKRIDEISNINKIAINDPTEYFLTKLNVITAKGAVVKVNGVVPDSQYGPFETSNIVANQEWVTYSIPGVTGNITIESDKAVTAGIASGNEAFGYGGYFAGFSAIPLILKTEGDCLPGVKLEVTAGFDSYEWLIKNTDGTYSPAPGINNTFTYEPLQAGIYAVKVKQGTCEEIQTQDFKFYNCTTYTNNDYNSCGTEIITPVFSLSTQTVDPSSVTITTQPTKGTVTIAANGVITYTANPGASGLDTFKYSFCGTGAIPDCETAQASIFMIEKRDDAILQECSTNGIATYDLALANVTSDNTLTKTYFRTEDGAQNDISADQILNFTNFSSADTFVYARLVNSDGCISVAKIQLKSKLAPEVKEDLYTKLHCDEDVDGKIDGIYKVDLSTITPVVLVQASDFVVRFYTDESVAIAGLNNNISGIFEFTADTSVWIRVDAPNGCQTVIKEIQLKTGNKTQLTTEIADKRICDLSLDNFELLNLEEYIALFTTEAATASYFNTMNDAQDNQNAISAEQIITANRSFYYRISVAGSCANIGTLNVELSTGTPSATLPSSVDVCEGTTTTLNVGTGYTVITWSTGATTPTVNLGAGTYWVDLTNAAGCVYRQDVSIMDFPKPQWDLTAYNATNCDDDFDGNIEVNLQTITPLILPNYTFFTVEYFADEGLTLPLPNNWTYSADTTIFVRASSAVCPTEIKQIDFKVGTSLTLINSVSSTVVCDNVPTGSEDISLADFKNLFTTDSAATVWYFSTLQDAETDTSAISAAQTISADQTFYYRFKKAGFCDAIGTLNILFKSPTPSVELPATVTVCEGGLTNLNVGTGYIDIKWSTGATTQTISVGAGTYWVDLTNTSGCVYRQGVTVLEAPKANWNVTAYNAVHCDSDFDGIITIDLSAVTPVILPNYSSFTVQYYSDQTYSTPLPNNWTYSADTTIYVSASSAFCPTSYEKIDFKIGNSLPLISVTATTSICDNDLSGSEDINLADYRSLFTSTTGVSVKYFDNLTTAQNNSADAEISAAQTISSNKTYYYRFSKTDFCDVIGTLNITFKQPKKSTVLADQQICPEATTTLDAGPGFGGYLWSTGETTSSIQVPVGDYWVELTTNGCVYKQLVSVTAVSLPEIVSVEIKGSTVTVTASGGNPPYQYALDNYNYQSSNVFTNVSGGDHTVYVISKDNCKSVSSDFNVIQRFNVITPNGDGKNDALDYSGLMKKSEPYMVIFDRQGQTVFTGSSTNRFIWDGKIAGRALESGSYWYVMKWIEPGFTTVTEYNGWILVKNRD